MKINDILLLLEYNRDITKQKIGDKLSVAGQGDRNVDVDTILQTLEEIDPTPNKQYVLWLANQYMKNLFRLEDKNRVKDVLQKFMQVKSRLPEKDIGRYTFHSLEEKMDELFNVQLSTQPKSVEPEQQTFQVPKGTKVLYNGPLGLLAIPLSYKASCILGSGTKWCTAATDNPIDARNTFLNYTKDGPLYIWRDKNGKKYQFHFDWSNVAPQFMDSKDRNIPTKMLKYFRNEHPVLKKMFEKEELKMFKLTDPHKLFYILEDYLEKISIGRNLNFEKLLIKALNDDPDISWDVYEKYIDLVGIDEIPEFINKFIKLHPIDAIVRCIDDGTPNEKIENLLLSGNYSPKLIIDYIDGCLGGEPWPEAEHLIIEHLPGAVDYATLVLRNRWPKLEKLLKPGTKAYKIYWSRIKELEMIEIIKKQKVPSYMRKK